MTPGGVEPDAPAAPLPPEAEAFLAHLAQQRRLSPHTVAAYRRDLAKLVGLLRAPAFAPDALPDAADIRRAAARLHGAGQAPASIARALSAWRSFFRWRAEQGLGDVNPAAGTRPPRRAQRLPKALAPDTAVRLAAHVADDSPLALRDHALIELLYSSGLRLAELVESRPPLLRSRGRAAAVDELDRPRRRRGHGARQGQQDATRAGGACGARGGARMARRA